MGDWRGNPDTGSINKKPPKLDKNMEGKLKDHIIDKKTFQP